MCKCCRQRELKRQEDLQRQQQEMLRQQEQRKREMEEMENQKQLELQRRQEQQRQQQEALKKLQQEQLANIQVHTVSTFKYTVKPIQLSDLTGIKVQKENMEHDKGNWGFFILHNLIVVFKIYMFSRSTK